MKKSAYPPLHSEERTEKASLEERLYLVWLITGDRNDSPSVHIAGGANAVAHGGGIITYNNGYTKAEGDASTEITAMIALLQKIIEAQNEQLAKKDEQIDGLIKAIRR